MDNRTNGNHFSRDLLQNPEDIMNEETLHRVWTEEQGLLDLIHDFCGRHNIRYSLGYGTLLGAVRHEGFIPWDDDIDLIMRRSEYDRFLTEWEREHPEGYILQNEYEKKDDYPNNFSKIRKEHTAFITSESERHAKYHKGFFIDVFPMDRVASGKLQRKIQLFLYGVYMLYSREYYDRRSSGASKQIQKFLLAFPPSWKRRLKASALKYVTKWNNTENQLLLPVTWAECHIYFPGTLMNDFELMTFNGKQYWTVKDYDAFLRNEYGDYMKWPPPEERKWRHSPVLIDFHHNYEEIGESFGQEVHR